MDFLIKTIETINRYAGYLAALLLIPLTVITSYEVFMRYIMERPTIWSWDLNIQIFTAIIMLGGGDTLRRKGHVAMDVVVQNLSARKRAALDIGTSVIFVFGLVILLWGGWDQAVISWKSREAMPTFWAPPYYTMKALIPIGAALVLLQCVAQALRNIEILFSLPQASPEQGA